MYNIDVKKKSDKHPKLYPSLMLTASQFKKVLQLFTFKIVTHFFNIVKLFYKKIKIKRRFENYEKNDVTTWINFTKKLL